MKIITSKVLGKLLLNLDLIKIEVNGYEKSINICIFEEKDNK